METHEEKLLRLDLAAATAWAGARLSRWAVLGPAVSLVGLFTGWRSPGVAESVGGMLISFAGAAFAGWCAWESQKLMRKSRKLMKGPE